MAESATCEEKLMDENFEDPERSTGDFIHYGILFFGFCFGVAGVISASAAVAITGFVLTAWGLAWFFVQPD